MAIKVKNFKLNEDKLTVDQLHEYGRLTYDALEDATHNYEIFYEGMDNSDYELEGLSLDQLRELWKENPEAFEVMDIDDLMEEYKENASEIVKLQERQEELKRYIEESLIKDGVEEYDSEIGKVKLTTKNAATSTNIDAELRLLNKDREKGDKIKKITMEVEKISKVCDIDANIELLKEHGIDLTGTKTSATITLAKGDE